MREMKDSGIPWIGEIPNDWDVYRLKHGTYMKGRIGWQGLKSEDFIDEGPFCITGTDFQNGKVIWSRCYHVSLERYNMDPYIQVKNGDLLITKDGTIGKLAIVDNLTDKACLNSHLLIIRPWKRYRTKYLFYILSSDVFVCYYNLTSSGSTMQSLSQEKLGEFSFPVCDLSKQDDIIKYLDAKCAEIDSLCADIRAEIETLEEYKRSVITEAVTKGLDPNVETKDSGAGWMPKIPINWKSEKFKYHLKRRTTRNPGTEMVLSLYRDLGIVIKDSRDDNHNVTSEDTSNYLYVRIGDFVVNKMKAWQGSVAVSNYEGVVSPAYYVYELTSDHLDRRYLHFLMRNITYTREFRRLSGGIREGQWDLSAQALENILILIPPKVEQIQIIQYLEKVTNEIESFIESKQGQLAILWSYKQALIYEYVTGKKEVPAD